MKISIVAIAQIILIIAVFYSAFIRKTHDELSEKLFREVGVFLLTLGVSSLVSARLKWRVGFSLTLIFFYTILSILLLGLIVTLSQSLTTSAVIAPLAMLNLYAIVTINSLDSRKSFDIKSRAIGLNVVTAFLGILIGAFSLLYVNVG